MISFHNIDCIEFMRSKPDNYYDLLWCDSPYGIGEDGSKNHSRGGLALPKKYKPYLGNDTNPPTPADFIELFRVSKNQIIWGANHFIENLPKQNSSSWIVWDKMNGDNDFADCELAWTSFDCAVRKFVFRWAGMLQQNMKNKQDRIHPNEKPIDLMRWALRKYATIGQKIYSPYGGGLGDAIACDIEGFDLDICEIDKEYFDAGVKRFNEHKRQGVLFAPETVKVEQLKLL